MSNGAHQWHPGIPTHDTAGGASHSQPRGANPGKHTGLHAKHAHKMGGSPAAMLQALQANISNSGPNGGPGAAPDQGQGGVDPSSGGMQ